MTKKTIKDIDPQGKKVFVRVDFNVPLSSKDPNDDITVTDDTRIRAALPTLNYLLDHGAALDLGFAPRPAYDRRRHAVRHGPGCDAAQRFAGAGRCRRWTRSWARTRRPPPLRLQPGDVLLLENTRFEPGETKNDPALSAAMADWPISTSTTRLAQPTAPMPALKARRRRCAPRAARPSPAS